MSGALTFVASWLCPLGDFASNTTWEQVRSCMRQKPNLSRLFNLILPVQSWLKKFFALPVEAGQEPGPGLLRVM
jgi:hypothetical protein